MSQCKTAYLKLKSVSENLPTARKHGCAARYLTYNHKERMLQDNLPPARKSRYTARQLTYRLKEWVTTYPQPERVGDNLPTARKSG